MIDTSADEMLYMIIIAPIHRTWRQLLEGVTHVDGSTRPQSVTADTHPLCASLLDEIAKLTGNRAVLNSSLNGTNKPRVETPARVLSMFALNGMDAIAIGPFLATAQRTRGSVQEESA